MTYFREENGSDCVWKTGKNADSGKRICILQIVARAANGKLEELRVSIRRKNVPFLGICITYVYLVNGLRILSCSLQTSVCRTHKRITCSMSKARSKLNDTKTIVIASRQIE